MKILHISNVCNQSGWSKQAEMHLLALDSTGVDVSARHVNILNNDNPDLHPRVRELLQKECHNPDIIIQNVLPSMYEYCGSSKNVGCFVCETSNFRSTSWARHMSMMDAIITPCWHNKTAAMDSGVDAKKIHIVREAIDTAVFAKQYDQHQIRKNLPDKFIFYTIGEFTVRKNVEAIIKAFHLEFSPGEPVELLIKTTPVGMSNPQKEINDRINAVKTGLKLYTNIERYKRENVICGFANDSEIYSLHASCDAYVCASRGEAFCIPLATAMGFGKTIVAPDHSGMDFINERNAFVVDSIEQPCFGAHDTLSDLYTSQEYWREVNIQSLRANMRNAYEKRSLALKKQQQAKRDIQAYSLENVGKIYKQTLEKILC